MSVKSRGIAFQADFILKGRRVRRSFPTEDRAELFETYSVATGEEYFSDVPPPSMLERAVKPRGLEFITDFEVGGRRVRRVFKSKERALEVLRASLARGCLYYPPEAMPQLKLEGRPKTLTELFAWVQLVNWNHRKCPRTPKSNAWMIVALLGDLPLSDIPLDVMDTLILKMGERGSAAGTINRKISTLQKALRWAEQRGWIEKMPAVRKLPEPRGRIRTFTPDEEQKILGWFQEYNHKEMRDLVILLADTGMRLGEAMSLLTSDCSFSLRTIRIEVNKADYPRSVPMTTRVFEMLVRRCKDGATKVFHPLTYDAAPYRWGKMREGLGYEGDPQFVLHTFRHTCASRLVQGGVGLVSVKEWLGHKAIQTTLRYAHLAPSHLQAAVAVLERLETSSPVGGTRPGDSGGHPSSLLGLPTAYPHK